MRRSGMEHLVRATAGPTRVSGARVALLLVWLALPALLARAARRMASSRPSGVQLAAWAQDAPVMRPPTNPDDGTRALFAAGLRTPRVAAAPANFTAQVMARVGAEPVPAASPIRAQRHPAPSLRGRARVVVGTFGLSAVLMLLSSFVAALVQPTFIFAALDLAVSLAASALAFAYLAIQSASGMPSTNGVVVLVGVAVVALLATVCAPLACSVGHALQKA